MVWATWSALGEAWNSGFMSDIPHTRRVDQCISISDAALRYGCDIENCNTLRPLRCNPLFEVVGNSREIPPQAMMDALRYLCNIGYDIEERNSHGETLFLFGVTQLQPCMITVLKFLIDKGADLCAVNPYGRGALHFALMAPDDWGAWDSSCTNACNHSSDFHHEDWASWLHSTDSEDYREDYCEDGLTPAPPTIDDIQSGHHDRDDGVQERLCRACGTIYFPTTDSTRSGSRISRSGNGQYIDLDDINDDNGDEETDVEDKDEDEDGDKGENNLREEEDEYE